eukprot:TRINITY_DN3867_c0_g1_i1.p1 TRINITY_DN3867_c0_g1~~TRINITY_DN3867_c0_g1_i1.p1  ORF type:complete len:199 (-),score=60.01 TRINITY_DN3867_c0_g1_i1:499-1095(-)
MAAKVEKLQRRLEKSQSTPTHVWWDGPADAARKRDLAELDQYNIMDRDGSAKGKCLDRRWRKINCLDDTRALRFGLTPSEKDLNKKESPARGRDPASPLCWKLDPYGARLGNTFMNSAHTRFQDFTLTGMKKPRFIYVKSFDKDFTKIGRNTNIIKVDITGGGDKHGAKPASPSSTSASSPSASRSPVGGSTSLPALV